MEHGLLGLRRKSSLGAMTASEWTAGWRAGLRPTQLCEKPSMMVYVCDSGARELGLLGLAGQSSLQVQWKPCLKTVRHTPEADLWALHADARTPPSTYVHTDTYRNMQNKKSSFSAVPKLTVYKRATFPDCEALCLQRL